MKLTPNSKVLEKLIVASVVKKFPLFTNMTVRYQYEVNKSLPLASGL
jgi:hypothetical protein